MCLSKSSLPTAQQLLKDLPNLLYPPQITISLESFKNPPVPPYIPYGAGAKSWQERAKSGSPPIPITSECCPYIKLNPEATRSLAMNK